MPGNNNKTLIGNIRGPQGKEGQKGEPGTKGDPGDLTQLGGIGELADIIFDRIEDIPDLTVIFDNRLL